MSSKDGEGVDVADIAKRYGGGGHRTAAAFQVPIRREGDRSLDGACP